VTAGHRKSTMPAHRHTLYRRGSHSDRRRHVIPFGHPYSCTPALNAIFEFNPSPSHSEVTRIMQQTGLRRKQITSWFWRKRKEAIESEEGDSKHVQFPQQGSYHLEQPASFCNQSQAAALNPPHRYGKPRDSEDEEYRPPSYAKIRQRAHDRSADLEPTLSRAKPGLNHDQRVRTVQPLGNRDSINPDPSPKPKSQPTSSSHISLPERAPILIRCRLRPLATRVLNESVEWERDENSVSSNSERHGSPSNLNSSIATSNHQFSALTPIQPCNDSDSSSTVGGHEAGAAFSLTFSASRNPSHEIACDVEEPSEAPDHLPISSHDSSLVMEEESLTQASSSAASSKQKQNDDIISNVKPDSLIPLNGFYSRHGDTYRCQLGLGMAPHPEEYSVSAARRMCAGAAGWLRPDHRLGYPGSGQAEHLSRNNSNAFRESSSESTDSSSWTQTETGLGICLRVSQEDHDIGSNSNLSTSSLGHEVHRWSELSEVDGASRYSSVSSDSRASRCTNATVEDYSALLGSSSDKIMMCESPTAREELAATRDKMEFAVGRSPNNVSIGSRSMSHPYHPLRQSSKTTAVFQENKELPFPQNTYLMKQQSEVEEDPRLFMVQGDHQEDFFNPLDWNPLGNFLNRAT